MTTLTAAESVAMDPAGLENVRRVFWRQIGEGLHPGAGLAVYRYGQLVLDICGGVCLTLFRRRIRKG